MKVAKKTPAMAPKAPESAQVTMLMTLGSMPEITAPLRSMETARMARPRWV